MHNSQASRFLAVVIRSGRFGYAAFESPTQLLDFGISRFASRASARTRIRTLLEKFRPSVLVLSNGAKGRQQRLRRKSIARMIHGQCRNASVPVVGIKAGAVRDSFRQHGKTNKYDRAVLVASWFPELAWKLPPQPKFYDPEPWVMASFDAVLLGAAHSNLKQLVSAEPK